jgi:hypothetical protein
MLKRTLYSFGSIFALIAIWLGYNEQKLRYDHAGGEAGPHCKHLKLGEEEPAFEKEVQQTIPKLDETLARLMEKRAQGKLDDPHPDGVYKRPQHPVAWGCVKAKVEIIPTKNSSDHHGLYARAASYDSVIRLSKSTLFLPDALPRASSIALKVFGVQGKRAELNQLDKDLRDANKDTQDLIFISHPTAPIAVVPKELLTLHEKLTQTYVFGAGAWVLFNRPTMIPRTGYMLFKGWFMNNPFLASHYTVAPTKLGDQQAIRLALLPCETGLRQPWPGTLLFSTRDFVRNLTQDYMDDHDVCMNLMIQKQTDPCLDRVDNFLDQWTGPFETVGKVTIPKGSKLVNDKYCEDLAFNPFHSLEENRPLGWVSRMRRDTYAFSSARRYEKNHEKQQKNIEKH